MSRSEHSAGTGRQQGQRSSQQGQPGQQSAPRRGQQPQTGQHSATTGDHGRQRRQPPAEHASRGSSVPIGFRLVSLAFAGMGLALVFGGLVVVQGANAMSAYAGPIGSSLTVVGLVLAGFGVGNLAAGYGTWTFTSWGRRLGLYIAVGAALGSASMLLMGGPAGPVGLLVHGTVAWYLYTNDQQYSRLRQMGA
ncbi:hypothetical protein [Halovenus sp. HT40]|uniref:hypothetical protein n=1 Tax=Halovenus sp. HT40 TaxID=3126691 RepID=UPI00300F13E2